ncbi:hypothetical protein ACLMJK_005293 [Lecanora helva]
MPTIPLHLTPKDITKPTNNPLPQLLQTPTGLAILEIQGTINLPPAEASSESTPVGRLVFPDHSPDAPESDVSWMKRVHLYVGLHQRLTGEVKKLPNPIAVIRKRELPPSGDGADEVEIMDIVYWKVVFSHRPEPVGT